MSALVEAMARAVHDAEWQLWWPSGTYHPDKERSWLDLRHDYLTHIAPACLRAMAEVEPSPETYDAAFHNIEDKRGSSYRERKQVFREFHRAMLRQAVAEAEEPTVECDMCHMQLPSNQICKFDRERCPAYFAYCDRGHSAPVEAEGS